MAVLGPILVFMTIFQKKINLHKTEGLENMAITSLELRTGKRIGLSGGGTYAKLFPLWAYELKLEVLEFFPVDERQVPIDSQDSNWGMAKRYLFDPMQDTRSVKNFASSALNYQALLKNKIAPGIPIFDTIYLGMGEDGHTASLFPGGGYLNDRVSSVLETESPQPPLKRITLGPGVIQAASSVILIINGNSKRDILKKFINGDPNLPAVQVLEPRKDFHLVVDKELLG